MNKIIKCNSPPRTFDFQLFTQLPLEATSNGKILQLYNPIPVCSGQASIFIVHHITCRPLQSRAARGGLFFFPTPFISVKVSPVTACNV